MKELHRRLHHYRAQDWEITLDDQDFSGAYLLWHAMNICSVGPVLMLAPKARTNDQVFDFVGAVEEDRALLMDYFKARAEDKERKFPIVAKRFNSMRLRCKKSPLHFDDEHWPDEKQKRPHPCDIEIVVKDSALRIWRVA